MVKRFKNGWVLKNHHIYPDDLWVEDGKIIEPQDLADEEVDVEHFIIAPGYIDLQINGGFGFDFSSLDCPLQLFSKKITRYGVTSFLPTIVSSAQQDYPKLLAVSGEQEGGANILGYHLEGPFLNEKRKGAHSAAHVRTFAGFETLQSFYGTLEGVRLVTLSPEIPDAGRYIRELKEKTIIAAIGHTEATYEEIIEATRQGVKLVTHLFNAMPPLQARQPGVIAAALTEPGLYYTVIADGVHCHPAAIRLAFRANPKGMIIVSDAMAALGLGKGNYSLGGLDVTVKDRRAVIKDTETLAGSVTALDAGVRYLHHVVGLSMVEALEVASLHPAELLQMPHKGRLSPGADADFILLDDQLKVKAVYVAGELVYKQ